MRDADDSISVEEARHGSALLPAAEPGTQMGRRRGGRMAKDKKSDTAEEPSEISFDQLMALYPTVLHSIVTKLVYSILKEEFPDHVFAAQQVPVPEGIIESEES